MEKSVVFNRLCAAMVMLAFCALFAYKLPGWYAGKFNTVKAEIEKLYETPPGETYLKRLFWYYTKYSGARLVNGVVILNDGRLIWSFLQNPPLLEERADVIIGLNDYLGSRDIPLIFMRAPNGMRDYSDLPKGFGSTVLEDGVRFMSLLQENGVKTLDYRELMTKEYEDFADAFFWGDHHWKAETALWAYGRLGTLLNDEYGFGLDEKTWDANEYERIVFENAFFGDISYRIAPADMREDITALEPKFETDFIITNAIKSEVLAQGDFADVFMPVSKDRNNKYFHYVHLNRYYDGFFEYTNLSADNDKKVLLIGDSFTVPFATYLAVSIEYVDVLYLQNTGNVNEWQQKKLYSLLETIEYDLVLFLCYDDVILYGGENIQNDRMYLGEPPNR
jgi:hypothetical protein